MKKDSILKYKNVLSIGLLKKYGLFHKFKNITSGNLLLSSGGLGVILEKNGNVGYLKIYVNGTDIIANRLETRDYGYIITLVTTKCNYGGFRWWFICPGSGKKCLNLYMHEDGKFYSRLYLNLAYPDQQLSSKQRELNNGLWKYNNKARRISETIKYPTRKGIKTRKQRLVDDYMKKISTSKSRKQLIDSRLRKIEKSFYNLIMKKY